MKSDLSEEELHSEKIGNIADVISESLPVSVRYQLALESGRICIYEDVSESAFHEAIGMLLSGGECVVIDDVLQRIPVMTAQLEVVARLNGA